MKKGIHSVGVRRILDQRHGGRHDRSRIGVTAWFFRISCSTFLAGMLFLCAWVTVSRPLAVHKGVLDYDDSTAKAPWVIPSILVVTTLLSIATKSQLETALSSIAEGITLRGQGLPFRMTATLAGYPGDGILSTLFPRDTCHDILSGSRPKSLVLNWKFASALSLSILLTGPLVGSLTYVLQPAVDASAIVSYAGTSTACGFNNSMEDLITAGSGCLVTAGESFAFADCLINTASEITGPFAAGEGTSLVESGMMRLRGSGLTVNYGVSQSTYDTSPNNHSINFGNAVASYPDRAWLESLVAAPGDCRLNASRNEKCSWDATGRDAPEMKAQGDIPIYNARVQCIRAVHFTELDFGVFFGPPITATTPQPVTTATATSPSQTLIPQALPSGDVSFQGPLAYVQLLLGSKPAFGEIFPQLKGKNSTVTFALIPAGLTPYTDAFDVLMSHNSNSILFICGAGVYLAKQSVTLNSRVVSIESPGTKFLDTELPVNLDLYNTSLTSGADAGPGLDEFGIDDASDERNGIVDALGRILTESWWDAGQKSISAPLHVTYGAAGSSPNQSMWLAGTVPNGTFEIPYDGAEKDVAQLLADALRLTSLGMSKPAWLKTVVDSSASTEFNSTLQDLMRNGSLGSNDLTLTNCTVLLPSVRFIGALRLGGQSSVRYLALIVILFHGILQAVLVLLLFLGYLPKPRRGTTYQTLALAIVSASRLSQEASALSKTPSAGTVQDSLYRRRIIVVEEEEDVLKLQ